MDCLLTPTAGTIYRIAEVQADPIRLNSHLGHYTNHMIRAGPCERSATGSGNSGRGRPVGPRPPGPTSSIPVNKKG